MIKKIRRESIKNIYNRRKKTNDISKIEAIRLVHVFIVDLFLV